MYADILSDDFPVLHRKLSSKPRIVFRWRPTSNAVPSHKLVLSGYGVGLDLKRVDYITIDDRDMLHDVGTAKEQRATRKEKLSNTDAGDDDDIFAQADAQPAELVQLKPEQLQGEIIGNSHELRRKTET